VARWHAYFTYFALFLVFSCISSSASSFISSGFMLVIGLQSLQLLLNKDYINFCHQCTSEEKCFSQNLSKGEIVVPMVGRIMRKQLKLESATCWIRCLAPRRTSYSALSTCQDKFIGTTCWTGCPSLRRISCTCRYDQPYLMRMCAWTFLNWLHSAIRRISFWLKDCYQRFVTNPCVRYDRKSWLTKERIYLNLLSFRITF
jgi:hypothetical protein